MAQIECGRGHLYDPEKYPTCPYCNTNQQITVAAAGRTAPIRTVDASRPAPLPASTADGNDVGTKRWEQKRSRTTSNKIEPQNSSQFPSCSHACSYGCSLVCSYFYENERIEKMALLCGFLKVKQILMGTNIYYLIKIYI